MSDNTQTELVQAPDGQIPSLEGDERSDWNPLSSPATYLLLLANIAVFAWMSPLSPARQVWLDHHPWKSFVASFDPADLVRFGAMSTLLVLDGQWFRILTAMFVHINPLHLLSNLWCLWNLGILGEPLVGPIGLIAIYILTGAAGFLLSMAWDVCSALYSHGSIEFSLTAGASGAVFGIAGILIILLSNRRLPIPWAELKSHRTAVLLFSIVNLVVGGISIFFSFLRIDNFAHVGGFACGIALGFPLLPRMTAGRDRYLRRQKITFGAAALVLCLFGYWIANLI
jgi:rhomboid protease GluP